MLSKSFNITKTEIKEYVISIVFLVVVPTLSVVVEMINAESAEITRKSLFTFFSTALLATLINLARMRSTNYQWINSKIARERKEDALESQENKW